MTSAPVAFFLALEHGTTFAAAASAGILAGTISQAAFALAYALLSRPGLWLATAAACLAFFASTAVLDVLSLGALPALLVTVPAVAVAFVCMPGCNRPPAVRRQPPAWDAFLRMAVATVFVVGITAASPALGPRLSGLLTPFPFIALTLTAFAHRQEGQEAAMAVLRGLLVGLFGPAVFFFVLAGLLTSAGITVAFGAAIAGALAAQGLALLALRTDRGRAGAGPPV
jgi:hypothetical protein